MVCSLEKAEHAVSLNLKRAAYDCACYATLLGKVDECRHWLTLAEAGDALPPLEHLQTNKDLYGVRETAWFQEMLTRQEYGGKDTGLSYTLPGCS